MSVLTALSLFSPSGAINVASKAGTLMFLRLVFADEMAGTQIPLMALGAASLVGRAALTTPQQRQLALKQLRRRSSAVPRRVRHAAAEIASGRAESKSHSQTQLLEAIFSGNFRHAAAETASGRAT